jgi:lipopolysaccharide/colanic/teichoic acid biosynthesis glycosyltransferase
MAPFAFLATRSETAAYLVLIVALPGTSALVAVMRHLFHAENPIILAVSAIHLQMRRENVVGLSLAVVSLVFTVAFWSSSLYGTSFGAHWWLIGAIAACVAGATLNAIYLRIKDPYVRLKDGPPIVTLESQRYLAFRSQVVQGWLNDSVDARLQVVSELTATDVKEGGSLLESLLKDNDSETMKAAQVLIDYIESGPFLRRMLDPVRTYVDGSLYGVADDQVAFRWYRQVEECGVEKDWLDLQQGKWVQRLAKRATDIVVSSLVLLLMTVVLPVIPAIVIMVRMDNRETRLPVVFKTVRIGRRGKPFNYYRFRVRLASKGIAESRVSQFLLVSGFDKLPALLNVFLGDLSLVGPAPLSLYYLARLGTDMDRRHLLQRLAVRPGLTGPSQQVALKSSRNGYRCLDYIAIDTRYAREWTYWSDLRILAQRAWLLVSGLLWRSLSSGVSPEDIVCAPASGNLHPARES